MSDSEAQRQKWGVKELSDLFDAFLPARRLELPRNARGRQRVDFCLSIVKRPARVQAIQVGHNATLLGDIVIFPASRVEFWKYMGSAGMGFGKHGSTHLWVKHTAKLP
jgi:hypothetical protein